MAPQSHGEAAEQAAEHASGAFPPFDPTYFASQLFWLAISFAVLYLLLSRWILPRIGGAIEERRDRIADDLDAAANMKAQADEAVREYEKSLADARAKAHSVAAEAKAESDRKIAEELAEVDADLDAKQAEAEGRIRESRDAALSEVRGIAATAAAAAVERLSGVEIAETDAQKAVDEARS
ncbi:F0F1 ATP synthase subunit B' [Marinicauda salina]|uniref:ATP synthase subunit b n=1 Tax=Marinicauda salina TaxID=2135793 RepID=A0A2U2BUD4_9PROT|nr:F0F1 ATP synthase subunit B [Marinicauda salina]PWE17641.1 F0F1 ATP synthase subunit B' [Marinicauda salina]